MAPAIMTARPAQSDADRWKEVEDAMARARTRAMNAGTHPTRTKTAGLFVDHADGTVSHVSFDRPMTLVEVAQEEYEQRGVWEAIRRPLPGIGRWQQISDAWFNHLRQVAG